MAWDTYIWTTLGAFLTISIFSFLYKDNPFYKFAEHLVAGVATGYFALILWHNGLKPNLFDMLRDGDAYFLWLNSANPEYLVPAILGAMMWTRFSKKLSWVSRWPMAIYIGIAVGTSIPLAMRNSVNMQLYSSMKSFNWGNFLGTGYLDSTAGFSELIVFVGMVCALFYFFFSKEHTGVFRGISKIGIGILMIGFGASFGYTVMARISLFVQRIQAVGNWTEISWSNSGMLVVWLLVIGLFLVLGAVEFLRFLRRKGAAPSRA